MSRYQLSYYSKSKQREYMLEEMATHHLVNARKKLLEEIAAEPKEGWDERAVLARDMDTEIRQRAENPLDEAAKAYVAEK